MFLEFVQISLIFPIKRQYFSCKPHIFLVRFICVYFIICYYCENGIYLISPITFSIVFSKSFHKIIIIFLKPYHGFCSTEKKKCPLPPPYAHGMSVPFLLTTSKHSDPPKAPRHVQLFPASGSVHLAYLELVDHSQFLWAWLFLTMSQFTSKPLTKSLLIICLH